MKKDANYPYVAASEKQEGGDHYQLPIQPFEFIHANGIPFAEGNVIKYVCRWRKKNGLEDLRKASHYLDLLIEAEEKRAAKAQKKPSEDWLAGWQ